MKVALVVLDSEAATDLVADAVAKVIDARAHVANPAGPPARMMVLHHLPIFNNESLSSDF